MVYALFLAKNVQCSMSNVHFFVTLHPENEKEDYYYYERKL